MGTNQSMSRSKTASEATLRDHVREISVGAFRDRKFSLRDVKSLVHEVLDGTVESFESSIPKSSKSVLRQVFDGLHDGVHAAASAASHAASDAGARAREAAGHDAPAAAKRIGQAKEEFLGAVRSFAGKASKHVRDELHDLADRAEKTGPKISAAARKTAKAVDGRWGELSQESAKAGGKIARRTVRAAASGASGFFQGIADSTKSKTAAPKGKSVVKSKSHTAAKHTKHAKKKPGSPRGKR